MEYRLAELLNLERLQALFDSFDRFHKLPSALIDIEGNILTATNWQEICTRFHRAHPQSERECIESDTHIASELSKGRKQVEYRCPKGLIDTATPIIVDGRHLGNAFTGQFFLEPPDEGHFRKLARKYGFDEEAYIEALRKVPVISREKHRLNLQVMAQLTSILAEMALTQKRQYETAEALRESRESFRALVEFTDAIHWELELSTMRFTYVSPQIEKILGYPPGRWADFDGWASTLHPDDREYAVNYCLSETQKGSDHSLVYRAIASDGRTVWLRDIVKVIKREGVPGKLIGIAFDITQLKDAVKEKEILLKEVHHRVKNNMAVISSLLSLQSRYATDGKYLDMLRESQSRIRSMALVHEKLYQGGDFAHIDVKDYIETLTLSIRSAYSSHVQAAVSLDIEPVEIDIDVLIPLGLIINELLTNALKYAFEETASPEAVVSLKPAPDGKAVLTVSDNGKGLPEGFDISKAEGLGLKLVNILTIQIDGELEVRSGGNGLAFILAFQPGIEHARHG